MRLMRLLTCLFLSLTIATVAFGQASWDRDIQSKATTFNLGRSLPETPRAVQTSSAHGNGWWQAFERGRVYWMVSTGALVVHGDIGDRWAALNREQGELGFPVSDELSVVGGDPHDRIQHFMGGNIYWRAATRETTVTPTVQPAPNYATTAPATVQTVASTATVAPLQYTVPGQAGHKWIDTGLDVKAGEMVYLIADGEVYYGANVGTHGPAGVAAPGVSGLPASTISRYGLVARLTRSRTNPEDDLREDHAYGDKEFCSRTGGRLWLTVNDHAPDDNRGEYIVEVKLGACNANPAPQPTPDPGRGTFRVKIVGFRVEHVVHDGLLDAGDDAYLIWDAAEFDADGRLVSNHRSGQSLVYGDVGRNRAHVQAGTQGENGGLKSGDEIKGRSAASPNRLPMLVGDFELVAGANAIVFSPTIWVANNDTGDNARLYRQQIQRRVRFLSYDVRERLAGNFQYFHWFQSLTRSPDDWFVLPFHGGAIGAGNDRPVGASRAFYNCAPVAGEILDFVPHTFLLTYRSVSSLFLPRESVPDLHRADGVRISQREFMFEARYRDSGPRGAYTILMTIERLDN